MRRIACWIFGHHNVRTKGLIDGMPDEMVCLRCFSRASFPDGAVGRWVESCDA